MFTILGLRLIPNIDGAEVDPAPAAAPVERIIGALGARNRNTIGAGYSAGIVTAVWIGEILITTELTDK